jgi:NifU-like protein
VKTVFRSEKGSLICGAVVEVSLAIDEDQRIVEARFRAAGCSFLVGVASLLTVRAKGRSTAEAAMLAREAQRNLLLDSEPVQAEYIHCLKLVSQAMLSAISQFSDLARDRWDGDGPLLCACFAVSERTVEQLIKRHGLKSITEIADTCNAGRGCGSCLPLITDLL